MFWFLNPCMRKRFFRNSEKYAIENLTLVIILFTALVSGFALYFNSNIGLISFDTFFSDRWWNIFFFPFRISGDAISLLFYLYIFWMFGSALEDFMGPYRYNLYILTGLVFVTAGSILFPAQIDVRFVYLSVFLAVAFIAPNTEIFIFFVLPLKIKWLALVTVVVVLYQTIDMIVYEQSLYPVLGPLLGAGNFLIFYGRALLKKGQSSSVPLRQNVRIYSRKETVDDPIHKCTTCGRTELDDSKLEFRYCNDCADHEYCMEHLHNHQHIRIDT